MTYTVATRPTTGDSFQPAPGIPQNMTLREAQELAAKSRDAGIEAVAFNVAAQ